ncbi:MAG: helix-turn-helix domain-containing protein [Nitrosopumilaceae archaeon]|nr:helix-turn-helix domain-containing protein [Nitrosopumilaceae archaeon]
MTQIPEGSRFLPRWSVERIRDLQEAETAERYKTRYEAAILRKEGLSVPEIAGKVGVSRLTVINWLRRMMERGLGKNYKVRQGRAPKFTPHQLKALERDMKKSPTKFGLDSERWTSHVVARHALNKFDITVAASSMRRLMLRENVRWPGSAAAMAKMAE